MSEKYKPEEKRIVRGSAENKGRDASRENQEKALARALDHTQYIYGERGNLPPEISKVIELAAHAQESIIKAQQKEFHPPAKWDKDGYNLAREIGNLREQAKRQLKEALEELEKIGKGHFIDIESEKE